MGFLAVQPPTGCCSLARHLPMLAALLHGRTHLNFQEFRQHHLGCFLHVLGLLELLQPQIFQSEHQGALWDCLRSFLGLLLVCGSGGLQGGGAAWGCAGIPWGCLCISASCLSACCVCSQLGPFLMGTHSWAPSWGSVLS